MARRRTGADRSLRPRRPFATGRISRCRVRSSSTSRKKAAERPEVQKFVDAYFGRPALIREVGYVELTPQIYDLAKKHFAERKVGTAFGAGGSQVGLTLEQLFTREQ